MIILAIIIIIQLFVVGMHLGHMHQHLARQDELLDWLVVRKGGNPEQIIRETHHDSEIGGPNRGY